MTVMADTAELSAELREHAADADATAWRRIDGGQEYCMGALLANNAADALDALAAENARLRAELRNAEELSVSTPSFNDGLRAAGAWLIERDGPEASAMVALMVALMLRETLRTETSPAPAASPSGFNDGVRAAADALGKTLGMTLPRQQQAILAILRPATDEDAALNAICDQRSGGQTVRVTLSELDE